MDTFDPKPRLAKEAGQTIPLETPTTVFNISNKIFPSPFQFKKHGQCGADVSDLFPHVATCVDDLVIIRSMVADHSEHTAANYFMHSGSGFQGRPSMGAWLTYGLGSACENLPGFVVLESGLIPPGGLDLFGSLQVDHSTLHRSKLRTSFHPTGLHHSLIVSHQQVTFNLLERVKDNTNKDQERRASVKLSEVLRYACTHGKGRHDGDCR